MAYGDYNGPDKPDKGKEGGSCNRGRCQCSPARWYNHGSFSWYCDDCAHDIGQDPVNLRDWRLRYEPTCGHPMFETREQMDARQNPKMTQMIDEAEANIREDYRTGTISKEQFQKELQIVARARRQDA